MQALIVMEGPAEWPNTHLFWRSCSTHCQAELQMWPAGWQLRCNPSPAGRQLRIDPPQAALTSSTKASLSSSQRSGVHDFGRKLASTLTKCAMQTVSCCKHK